MDANKIIALATIKELLAPKRKTYTDGRPPIGTEVMVDGERWEVVDYWERLGDKEDGVTLDRGDGEDFGLFIGMDKLREYVAATPR